MAHGAAPHIHGTQLPRLETVMKSIILWACGVPLGVIILLKVFGVY